MYVPLDAIQQQAVVVLLAFFLVPADDLVLVSPLLVHDGCHDAVYDVFDHGLGDSLSYYVFRRVCDGDDVVCREGDVVQIFFFL